MTTIDRAQSGNGAVRAFKVTPQEREQLREDAAESRRPVRKKAKTATTAKRRVQRRFRRA